VRPGKVIQTSNGKIRGSIETYGFFKRIHTYKGIPYAKPPLGNLRFRAPVPPENWTGIKNATKFGPICPQSDYTFKVTGQEDCLYLNVFTPSRITSLLPVLMFIHGGGFLVGSGETDYLGPETCVEENVIVVTINYRLGVLGFLNTGDRHAPGNFGMKDKIQALRWIQENIEAFGGNPKLVSIMGTSSGGASVHALVLSPAAKGLFHRAIAQSGSMLNDWAFNYSPQEMGAKIARILYLHYEDNEDLVRRLREVSAERLAVVGEVLDKAIPWLNEPAFLAPSLDPVDTEEIRIFPDVPLGLVKAGNFSRVPYLVGYNSMESFMYYGQGLIDRFLVERFDQNLNQLVPVLWGLRPNSPEALKVSSAVMATYFNGSFNGTDDLGLRFVDYLSDTTFIHGTTRQAELHSALQDVYFYRFSYSGAFNFFKRATGLMEFPGAAHSEDLFYLLRQNQVIAPVMPNDRAFTIRKRQVRLWTNFIKFGVPTPVQSDPLIDVDWPKMSPENVECLDIGDSLVLTENPDAERMDLWRRLDRRFDPVNF
jgi:bile salt-stimulated lipase